MRTALFVLGTLAAWAWIVGMFILAHHLNPMRPEGQAFLVVMLGLLLLPVTVGGAIALSRIKP